MESHISKTARCGTRPLLDHAIVTSKRNKMQSSPCLCGAGALARELPAHPRTVRGVPQVSLLTPGKVRLFSITPSLRAGAIECSLAQLRSSGAGRVAQVRALVLGANPSTPLRAGSGIRNILSGPPCACLSRSRAVHSDSISTTPFFSQRRMTETAPLPISRFQDQPPLHWIAMNITQLLAKLALLAVIVALLPKCASPQAFGEGQLK